MNKKILKQGSASLLALCTVLLTLYTGRINSSTGKSDAVQTLQISQWMVQQELMLPHSSIEGLRLSTAFALRQVPLLHTDFSAPTEEQKLTATESEPSMPAQTVQENNDLTFPDNGVPSQTVIAKNPAGYTIINGVYIKNASNKTLNTDALSGDFAATLQPNSPQVLILHTHGSEAYSLPEGETYHSTGNYRTDDAAYSVIRVGDEIAATLSSYGISVLHDRERYDDPLYEGAYDRSDAAIRAYLEKYPSITYILDIHRDAVQDSNGQQYKLVAQEDETLAQLSFIMGSNHEGWEENLKLAVAVSAKVTEDHPTAMRPITLRNSNYNQDYTLGSMLVEVGTAGNSPDEAVHAGRVFADAFARTILDTAAN